MSRTSSGAATRLANPLAAKGVQGNAEEARYGHGSAPLRALSSTLALAAAITKVPATIHLRPRSLGVDHLLVRSCVSHRTLPPGALLALALAGCGDGANASDVGGSATGTASAAEPTGATAPALTDGANGPTTSGASTSGTTDATIGSTSTAATTTAATTTDPTTADATSTTGEPDATSTGALGDTTGDGDTTSSSTTDMSGSGSSSTGEAAPPEPPTLQLAFSPIKQFEFSWAAVQGATHYQLLERPTPSDDYLQLGGDLPDLSITLTMPLHLRFGASYILNACNGDGCTGSAPVDVVDSLATAVGYFKASNTGVDDRLGFNVALSADGTTLAVGAHGEGSAATGIDGDQLNNNAFNSGAVYVFARKDGVWTQQAYVKASNTQFDDNFGSAVALSADGGTLVVGAPGEASAASGVEADQFDNSAPRAGAAYVFTRSGAVWSQQAYLKASNAGANDRFGGALALSGDGDTLAVGAYGEGGGSAGIDGDQNSNTFINAGAVYVFARSGSAWSQKAYVKASDPWPNDNFGREVALSGDGDTLAVGAYLEDSGATGVGGDQANNAKADSGAVYVFVRTGGAWSQQSYVKASNTDVGDWFGSSLALSGDGDTLAVGAYREDSAATGVDGDQANNAMSAAGAVYVFTRTAAVWSQQAYLKASNTGVGDWFGYRVALSGDGDMIAVGAPLEDSPAVGLGGDQADDSIVDPGAAYVFARKNAAWSQRAYLKASNTGAGDWFGLGLALSADGQTLAVGAPREDSAAIGIGGDQADDSASSAGAIYLY